jgi:U4/U6.U5 tri-snRNP-associated protein 2
MKVMTEIAPAEGETENTGVDAMETDEKTSTAAPTVAVEYRPFRYLSLALPAAPLFQDGTDKAIIPQVPLFDLLKRFDGQTIERDIDPETKRERKRTYSITKLPPYLIVHYQRFAQNTFFAEKNPTLVSFPLESLEMRPYTSGPEVQSMENEDVVKNMSVAEIKKKLRSKHIACDSIVEKQELVSLLVNASKNTPPPSTRYDLISNIVHDGKPKQGSYKCHSLHHASHTWYTTEDLHVWTTETMAQQIALSEAYIQIYRKQ